MHICKYVLYILIYGYMYIYIYTYIPVEDRAANGQ